MTAHHPHQNDGLDIMTPPNVCRKNSRIFISCQSLTSHRSICACIIASIISLTACAQLTTVREDGSFVKHYLGYVRITTPKSSTPQFDVQDVSAVGLRIVKGVGVGYFHERTEHIPLDCRVVVRVVDEQQLEKTIETWSPILQEGLCAVVEQ